MNSKEEILKWRQQQVMMNYNHGENTPFFLSQQQQQQQEETPLYTTGTQYSSTNSINSPLNNNIKKSSSYFYITLAKESPKYYDENDSDTTATYDSYHDRTTDVCMDPCDTDSNSSDYSLEGIATLEVVEYEVASASASEDLYSHDSSSGTDEDLIAISKFLESECLSSIDDKQHGCGFWSSDFADTEESDNSDNCIDSELSPADYWICVKCKNRQNNPMFRYCEKCYKIRKTHFPPRPKLRKKRKNRKRKEASLSPAFNSIDRNRKLSNSPTSNCHSVVSTDHKTSQSLYNQHTMSNSDASTSTCDIIGKDQLNLTNSNYIKFNKFTDKNSKLIDRGNKRKSNNINGPSSYKKHKLNYTNSNVSQLNSAAETFSSDNDDDDYSSDLNSSLDKSSNLGKKFFSHKSQIYDNTKSANINDNCRFNNISNNRKRKASVLIDGGDDIDLKICSQNKMNCINIIDSDINLNLNNFKTEIVVNKNLINNEYLFDKDSGIGSVPSTQDFNESISEQSQPHCSTSLLLPNSPNSDILLNKLINNDDGNDSSDTVTDELNEKDIFEIEKNGNFSNDIIESNNIKNMDRNNELKPYIGDKLERHLSEFPPLTTNYNTLIPRSISANSIDQFKTNLKSIPQSPQSETNPITVNNNGIRNFDDKLSSLLNPLDNQIDSSHGLCIICVTEPKNGAFVHSRFVHLSCCYKCAVKIWNKNKKCPICNCAVKNVMKLFVH